MKKQLLIFCLITISSFSFAQQDCFTRLEEAFAKRGSYTVADDMHRNVIISYFSNGETNCVSGKVRVENGVIVNIFLQYSDGTYELMEKKFFNSKKQPPVVTNGISEMISTVDGETFRIVFIEKLKPKSKSLMEVALPDDL